MRGARRRVSASGECGYGGVNLHENAPTRCRRLPRTSLSLSLSLNFGAFYIYCFSSVEFCARERIARRLISGSLSLSLSLSLSHNISERATEIPTALGGAAATRRPQRRRALPRSGARPLAKLRSARHIMWECTFLTSACDPRASSASWISRGRAFDSRRANGASFPPRRGFQSGIAS